MSGQGLKPWGCFLEFDNRRSNEEAPTKTWKSVILNIKCQNAPTGVQFVEGFGPQTNKQIIVVLKVAISFYFKFQVADFAN